MKSSVNHEIDAARVRGATICGQCGPTGDNRHLWKPKFATDTMCTEEGKRILDRELAKYYPPPWTLHVDRHCQHLQEFLIDVMTKTLCPRLRSRKASVWPQAEYLQQLVWRRYYFLAEAKRAGIGGYKKLEGKG